LDLIGNYESSFAKTKQNKTKQKKIPAVLEVWLNPFED
jgi:hypothetical protein